jgi:hypothetical protein
MSALAFLMISNLRAASGSYGLFGFMFASIFLSSANKSSLVSVLALNSFNSLYRLSSLAFLRASLWASSLAFRAALSSALGPPVI